VLPSGTALELWDSFKPRLIEAVNAHPAESETDLEEVRTDVRRGKATVLQIYEQRKLLAVAVVELLDLSDGRSLHVRYLAGDGMDAWMDKLEARLQDMARDYGCVWVSIIGRLGWYKALKSHGFVAVSMELRKRVS